MKHKKTKKLSINKLTIASLNGTDMVKLNGGGSENTCETVCASDCRSCTQDTYCSWYLCP